MVEKAVNHFYSYLKSGGIIRFIVPHLKSYIKYYLAQLSDPTIAPKTVHQLMVNSCLGAEKSRKNFYQRWRQAFSNSRYQWMWDEPYWAEGLVKRRFENIRRCKYGDWHESKFELAENLLRSH